MPEGSRYKFEGMQVDQPNAGVGGVDLGNLYASFRGIDRSAWQLQDETIQKDLLAGASPQAGASRYNELAKIAGAAGDSLQSVIFQQKANSLLAAAGNGSGGGGSGRRGSGSGSGKTSKTIKAQLSELQGAELDKVQKDIQVTADAIKNGSVDAKTGFEQIASTIAGYSSKANDLYNSAVSEGASEAQLTQILQESNLALGSSGSSGASKIQKALRENVYGSTISSDTDAIQMLSKHLTVLDGNQDAHLALIPKQATQTFGETLNGIQKPTGFDIQITDSKTADDNYLARLQRKVPGQDAPQDVFVQPLNYKDFQSLLDKAAKTSQDSGGVISQDEALKNLLLTNNLKLDYQINTTGGDNKVFSKKLQLDPTTNQFIHNNNQVGDAINPPVVEPLLGAKGGGAVFGDQQESLQNTQQKGGFDFKQLIPFYNDLKGAKKTFDLLTGSNEAQAAELPDPFAGVTSGVQGKASRLVDNEMEPLKIQAIKQMNLTPEAEKYAMNIPITSGKLKSIDGRIIDGVFKPGSNEIVIDKKKMEYFAKNRGYPDVAYSLVGVIQHELLHALQAKFLPKVGKKSDPVSQAVESYFGLKRQDAGFRAPNMLEKNPSTNFGQGLGNNAKEDFAMGNLPLKAYGAIFKTNNRGGFLGENTPPGFDAQAQDSSGVYQPPTPLYNILMNNPNVFQPNGIAPLSQRYSNANPLGGTMGQLNSQLLNRFFPDQQASINQNAEPTNNVFQSIVDTIAKRNQPAKKQGAAYQAPVVQMPESQTSVSKGGLVSKAGGGYSNPFAGAKGGVQGQVTQAAQNRMDPLQLRNQASMAALNGFKSFANFIKGIF